MYITYFDKTQFFKLFSITIKTFYSTYIKKFISNNTKVAGTVDVIRSLEYNTMIGDYVF